MHYPDSKTIVVLNLHQQQQQHVKSVRIALNLSKSALTSTISLLPNSNFDRSVTKAMQNVTLSRLSSLTYPISQITFTQILQQNNNRIVRENSILGGNDLHSPKLPGQGDQRLCFSSLNPKSR